MRIYFINYVYLLVVEISDAADSARSDDTGKLKFAILNYIHEDVKKGSKFDDNTHFIYEPLFPHDHKDYRGFRHVDTANLLCPIRLKEEFDTDPRYAF